MAPSNAPAPEVHRPAPMEPRTPERPTAPLAAHQIGVGTVLRDRYELQALLGRGGMGSVFRALDRYRASLGLPDRYVALKIAAPLPGGAGSRALGREFQSAQQLSHPNVINVYDIDHEGAASFYTMELLEGARLSEVLQPIRAAWPVPQALAIVRDIGAAVAHAHSRGIVHADLKPQNVFITIGGQVRVLDFGGGSASGAAAEPWFGDPSRPRWLESAWVPAGWMTLHTVRASIWPRHLPTPVASSSRARSPMHAMMYSHSAASSISCLPDDTPSRASPRFKRGPCGCAPAARRHWVRMGGEHCARLCPSIARSARSTSIPGWPISALPTRARGCRHTGSEPRSAARSRPLARQAHATAALVLFAVVASLWLLQQQRAIDLNVAGELGAQLPSTTPGSSSRISRVLKPRSAVRLARGRSTHGVVERVGHGAGAELLSGREPAGRTGTRRRQQRLYPERCLGNTLAGSTDARSPPPTRERCEPLPLLRRNSAPPGEPSATAAGRRR